MIRKQILFKIIKDAADICGAGCLLEDQNGKVIASSGDLSGDCDCRQVMTGMQCVYNVKVYGKKADRELVAKLLKSQLEILLSQNDSSKVQQQLIDAIIKGDVERILQGKKDAFLSDKWHLYVIREDSQIGRTESFLRDFYKDSANVAIGCDDNDNIVVVNLKGGTKVDVKDGAEVLLDLITMEAMTSVHIGYTVAIDNAYKCQSSYQQAKQAVAIGIQFSPEEKIYNYRNLGIGKLLAGMDPKEKEQFAEEVLGGEKEALTEDEILTAKAFFECNLNISETARQLYVHRNSLLYRLDKIEKKTGLDIRQFDDAVKLKLAMMAMQ